MAARGADVSHVEKMVPRLESLLRKGREIGVPIVWVQTWRDETTESKVWKARRSLYLEPSDGEVPAPNCIKGTWGADFYEIAPELGEPVIQKTRYNAFTGTQLEVLLRTIGRPCLLFTGVSTNVCVDSTLREAVFRDFHVGIVADCCAASNSAAHHSTLQTVTWAFGPVLQSRDVMDIWASAQAAGL